MSFRETTAEEGQWALQQPQKTAEKSRTELNRETLFDRSPRRANYNSEREHLNCICCTINPPAFNSSSTKVKSEDGSKWIYCHNQCPITHLTDSFIFSFWAQEYMNNLGPARPSLSSGRRWSMWFTKRMMQTKTLPKSHFSRWPLSIAVIITYIFYSGGACYSHQE